MEVIPLERRELLDGSHNAFANISGELRTAHDIGSSGFLLDATDFVTPEGRVLLGLTAQAEGSGLNPGRIRVVSASPKAAQTVVQKNDSRTSSASLLLANLKPGDYSAKVASQAKTSGTYNLKFFLAGDANDDFQVDQSDLTIIKSLIGVKSKNRRYLVDADVNGDGVINHADLQLVRRNLGVSTSVRPLSVTVGLDPASDPAGIDQVTGQMVTVDGQTQPGAMVRVADGIDGTIDQFVSADISGRYRFQFDASLGINRLQISADDRFGQMTSADLTFTRVAPPIVDTQAPVITITGPLTIPTGRVNPVFQGRVTDGSSGVGGLFVEVDGGQRAAIPFDAATGEFLFATGLPVDGTADGRHTVEFDAIDRAGNVASPISATFTLDTRPPTITLQSPGPGAASRADPTIVGRVADATTGVASLLAQVDAGPWVTVTYDATGMFRFTPALRVDGSADGDHTARFMATDAVGLSSQAIALPFRLDHTALPDPSQIAPTLAATTATSLLAATSFLYTGPEAIQTGVAPGTITLDRAAVVRGMVLAQAGDPLSGIAITVLNHPEYGQTYSRADGMLDLAVDGGGPLTIEYAKAGYLPIERQIDVLSQDYAMLPDVVMSPLDSMVTTINLASTQPFQVARGSAESDGDGTRRATLLFPQGLQATMTLAGGTTQPLTSLDVRATEYTVGPDGPEAMPGTLPPTSGYTYAVEFSDDAALQAGATRVNFNQAIPFYLENFLNFPTGMTVPTGYLDRQSGRWIASTNGRVIKVQGEAGGTAALDIDGSGNAATSSALAALGMSDEERVQIAALYKTGESLWRVPIAHFTPFDTNWPYGPQPGDKPPQIDPKAVNSTKEDNPTPGCGSVIGIENQTLGETVPIAGTPFSLVYQSDRTIGGNVTDRTLTIPLTDATAQDDLKRVDLTISIAGRQFTHSFDPAANLSTAFTWDGLDAYGRPVQGSEPVTINIGYVYTGMYYAPADKVQAFAAFSGIPLTANRSRQEVTLTQVIRAVLQSPRTQSDGLGGWTLDNHNQYDPTAQVLHLGDGLDQTATANVYQSIATIAGNGSLASRGDGGLATLAYFQPSSIAAGPDGSIYIADSKLFVRRVSPGGIITTIAGNGTTDSSGDGGSALKAGMSPDSVTLGPDGSIYIGDSTNAVVRRIGLDGIITTVAGSGPVPFFGTRIDGDGGPAIQGKVYPTSIAVASDGTLYIADEGDGRVRRVGVEGIITTIAGNGTRTFVDGVQATQSGIRPTSIALRSDGSLIVDEYNVDYLNFSYVGRISVVGADGVIHQIAQTPLEGLTIDPISVAPGPNDSIYFADAYTASILSLNADGTLKVIGGFYQGGTSSGDGGPAINAGMTPGAIALAPDGGLLLVDADSEFFDSRVRKIDANGIIDTVAGGSTVGGSLIPKAGDLAAQTGMHPTSVAVSPAHDIYIADIQNNAIHKVSPDGTIRNITVDGRQDGLDFPHAIAFGPDASLYIVEQSYNSQSDVITRVTPDGTTTRFAGDDSLIAGFSGDGGPALAASFNLGSQTSIAVAPDGSVYIADTGNNRIRRIGTDGLISTVAGGGDGTNDGDGGPAAQAILTHPDSIALGPDGSLYIGDADRVRRVSPAGIIATVAGGGAMSGDGVPATQAQLFDTTFFFGVPISSVKVAVDKQGNLFIGEGSYPDIRRVGTDGIITTVAGDRTVGFSGDGSAASNAEFSQINGLAVDDEGRIFVVDGDRVREVQPIFPGTSSDDILVPSSDGGQVYEFDHTGRHLRTVDALTGALIDAFAYDPAGQLASITDGNVTTIDRDAGGIPTAIVSPYGQRTALTVNAQGYLASVTDPAGEMTTLGYGAGGLLTSMTDPLKNSSILVYDASGRLISDQNAADGFTKLERTELGGGSYKVTTTNAVDGMRQYLVELLPDGSKRRTSIDGRGFATVTLEYSTGTSQTTAPDGTITTAILGPDPRFGMLAPVVASHTVKLPSGLTSTITDVRTEIDGSSGEIAPALLIDTVKTNGKTSTTSYDGTTRTITSTSATGRTGFTMLDAKGRVVLVQIPGVASTSFAYDTHGRLIKVSQGDRTVTYSYDAVGDLEQITDPLNRSVTFSYDADNRLVRQTQPDGSVIAFRYDASGNMVGLTPPGEAEHTFAYTADNRLNAVTPPAAGPGDDTTRYTYNLAGQVIKESLPGGSDVLYAYCECGRLTSITTPLGTYGYTYSSTTGDLSSLTSPDGLQLDYGYDGALLTSTTLSGPVAGKVSWTYNADFRVTSESVNGGNTVAYAYDKDGLLTQAGSLILTRDTDTGFLAGTSLGSVTDSLSYDSYGEASTYQAKIGQGVAYEDEFTRDKLGHISRRVETIGGVTTTTDYGYDSDDRLTTVTENGVLTQTYAYDANGNRLSLTTAAGVVTGTYDAQDRLLTYGTKTYTYTPAGQLLQVTDAATGQKTHYTYDVFGNLTHVDLPGGHTVDYLIDGQDRRVGEKVDGVLTEGLIYSGQLQPVAETDGSSNVVERFVYGTGVNVPEYMVKGGVTYRFITDQLGSVRLVVNAATGEIAQRLDYDAFGKVLIDTDPGFQPFGFAGGLYDSSTNLTRFGVRDYDTTTGRWMSSDPIGYDGLDTNLYNYSLNDPIDFSDSSGKNPIALAVLEVIELLIPIAIDAYRLYNAAQTLAALNQLLNEVSDDENAPAQGSDEPCDTSNSDITTPGGRTLTDHAQDRMNNPPPGRAPMTPSEVDQVLDTADRIVKATDHPKGVTLTVQSTTMPGKPKVVVDMATGNRVVNVIKNK